MGEPIPYLKMNGLGNDFVIVDVRATGRLFRPETVRRIADREHGLGCDQFILIAQPSVDGVDVAMRIFNADGGQVDACGNATRCIAALVAGETGKASIIVETSAGLLPSYVVGERVTVDMGVPRFDWQDIPLAEEFRDTRGIELQIGPIDDPVLHTPSVVNVGNPHAIFWVDDVESHDLERFGPLLENHPIFPERANISLARVVDREHIKVRTWERGVGLTRACGTAACAAVVCAARKKLTERKVVVELPGGSLDLEWRESDGHILMSGPWTLDGEGVLPEDLLGEAAA
jgi:diaminopimelate epimerase